MESQFLHDPAGKKILGHNILQLNFLLFTTWVLNLCDNFFSKIKALSRKMCECVHAHTHTLYLSFSGAFNIVI